MNILNSNYYLLFIFLIINFLLGARACSCKHQGIYHTSYSVGFVVPLNNFFWFKLFFFINLSKIYFSQLKFFDLLYRKNIFDFTLYFELLNAAMVAGWFSQNRSPPVCREFMMLTQVFIFAFCKIYYCYHYNCHYFNFISYIESINFNKRTRFEAIFQYYTVFTT